MRFSSQLDLVPDSTMETTCRSNVMNTMMMTMMRMIIEMMTMTITMMATGSSIRMDDWRSYSDQRFVDL